MTTADHDEVGDAAVEIWARPHGQLLELPPKIRWEVTRRHPYYVVFWREAARFYRNESGADATVQQLDRIASIILSAIGVTSCPPDPKTQFEQLDSDPKSPTMAMGSVQPVTLFTLVAALVRTLPDPDLKSLADLFAAASEPSPHGDELPEDRENRRALTLQSFSQIASPVFASVFEQPFWYVHVEASQRTIQKDMGQLVKAWKAKLDLPTRRLRKENFEEYLEIWDAREGWRDGGYDDRKPEQFQQIAERQKNGVSTVFAQYRQAFELVTGYPFDYELWWRLMAPIHMSQLLSSHVACLTAGVRRRFQANSRRPVPESVLMSNPYGEDHRRDFIGKSGDGSPTTFDSSFMLDLWEAIQHGRSNQEIGDLFSDRNRPTNDQIQIIRDRFKEFVEIELPLTVVHQ
ncbi:MAG: hypothetical protein AABP62_12925 [Planctomycetota bacterium]